MASKKTQTQKLLKIMEERKAMAEDSKFYQYKENINGTEYVFQYCGKRKALQITDECSNDKGKTSKEKLVDAILKTLVVSPSVDIDYFDDPEHMDDFDRVTEIANIIFSGKFRHNEKLKLQK